MTEPLKWWVVSAGTEDGKEGERDGSVRATTQERAAELYLSQRPASWVIHEIREGTAPETLPTPPAAEPVLELKIGR